MLKRMLLSALTVMLLAFTMSAALATESYSAHTPVSGAGSDKLNNLRLAAQAIDGWEVPTGSSFSFNEVVGPREQRRGYRKALNGRGVQVTGGGVAQVASTLYMALLDMGDDVDIDPVKTYGNRFTDDYVQNPSLAIVTDYDAGIDLSFTNLADDMVIDMWLDNDNLWCVISVGQSGGLSVSDGGAPGKTTYTTGDTDYDGGLDFLDHYGKYEDGDTDYTGLTTEDEDAYDAGLTTEDEDAYDAGLTTEDEDAYDAGLTTGDDENYYYPGLTTGDDEDYYYPGLTTDDDGDYYYDGLTTGGGKGLYRSDLITDDDEYTTSDLLSGSTVIAGSTGNQGSARLYCGGDKDVLHNVALAADCLSDTVLNSGDAFSFNDIVGPRTQKYGYRRATNGRGAKVVGGGVAQVASALWLAIEDCDCIDILEKSTYGSRYNQHYVDDEDDAILTDYSSGKDFRFRYTGKTSFIIYTYVMDGWLYCDVFED